VGVQVKTVRSLENMCHTWDSSVVIHYEEALYQMYAPLPLPFLLVLKHFHKMPVDMNKL